jgi:hypothetical protein
VCPTGERDLDGSLATSEVRNSGSSRIPECWDTRPALPSIRPGSAERLVDSCFLCLLFHALRMVGCEESKAWRVVLQVPCGLDARWIRYPGYSSADRRLLLRVRPSATPHPLSPVCDLSGIRPSSSLPLVDLWVEDPLVRWRNPVEAFAVGLVARRIRGSYIPSRVKVRDQALMVRRRKPALSHFAVTGCHRAALWS